MSRTYRDVTRGRLRYEERLFDENPDNQETYWYKSYRLRKWSEIGKPLLENMDPVWHQSTRTKIELQEKQPWNLLTHKQRMYIAPYSTPSAWNNVFHTRPRRAEQTRKLKTVIGTHIDDLDDLIFMLPKKPHNYYW